MTAAPTTLPSRLLAAGTWLAPVLAWLAIAVGTGPAITGVVLVAVVLAAVHHAETVAHRIGEPFGTLVLAVAVTVIEVGLILSLMLANPETTSSLARDTVFAAAMIILNFLLGLCLLVGGFRLGEQRFTRTGVTAALSTLATLIVLTLILPNFTSTVPGPVYSPLQLGFVAVCSLVLYLTFVFVQTIRHRAYFLPSAEMRELHRDEAPRPSVRQAWQSFALLCVSLVAVVLMAKSLSNPLEDAVAAAGLPLAMVGVAIAGIVLLPESVAAVRAARAGQLQTSLNLALGSALATIGLTIPAVTVASFILDLPLALGLRPSSMALLALTLFIASLSIARGRTTVLHGAVHLVIFGAFILTNIAP
ncbi:ionic transporter y4hA [Sphingomonas sabuli]|uniref:Ionic transporter y4hA n=1 Tax=Sphingomonas sabuli TaxID=2764186 RepID=A0A7G9L2D7_9SPHN|nr:ionic transporter y4hA [Sphingomonas sabuli]QNM82786.1 ionic transporter y4hA [Sphingomonas sabuli]